MEPLLYIGFPAAVTVTLAVLFCRHRVALKRQVSFGTVAAAALGGTLVTFVCGAGTELFTPQFWIYTWNNQPGVSLIVLGSLLIICSIPAAVVVEYYRFRINRALRRARASS